VAIKAFWVIAIGGGTGAGGDGIRFPEEQNGRGFNKAPALSLAGIGSGGRITIIEGTGALTIVAGSTITIR